MMIFKVQCNVLNYTQYEGSRYSYVQNLHCVQFCIDCRKSLWTFSCDIWTDTAVRLPFHGIQTYPQIHSNANISMTGWKNICYTSGAWNLQHLFGLIFVCVFQIQTLFSIHLCVRGVSDAIYKTFLSQYSDQMMNSYANL